MNRDQYLAHFGVKGMRWGFRKKREESQGSEGVSRKKHTVRKVLTAAADPIIAAAITYAVATGQHTKIISSGRDLVNSLLGSSKSKNYGYGDLASRAKLQRPALGVDPVDVHARARAEWMREMAEEAKLVNQRFGPKHV